MMSKKLVKDCLYPEAVASLGGAGSELANMTLEEFVAAYDKHFALPNYSGENNGANLPDTPEVFSHGGTLKAAAQAMGLPYNDARTSYVVPGEDWVSRMEQEQLDAAG